MHWRVNPVGLKAGQIGKSGGSLRGAAVGVAPAVKANDGGIAVAVGGGKRNTNHMAERSKEVATLTLMTAPAAAGMMGDDGSWGDRRMVSSTTAKMPNR